MASGVSFEQGLVLVIGNQHRTIGAEDGARGIDTQIAADTLIGRDTQQGTAAEEDFAIAPGRPFGVTRRFGKVIKLDGRETLGEVTRGRLGGGGRGDLQQGNRRQGEK